MQKNIFNVLAVDDSDDDVPKNSKVTKKSQKQQEKVVRQNVGDQVHKSQKDNYDRKQQHDTQKPRGGKREFDRQSGTGRQAFGNRKQGGFGKGNEAEGDPLNHVEEAHEEVQKEETEKEAPKIKSVDDYFQGKNMNFGQKKQEQAPENNKKKTQGKKGKSNLITQMDVGKERRTDFRGKQKRQFVDLKNNEEFPTLG